MADDKKPMTNGGFALQLGLILLTFLLGCIGSLVVAWSTSKVYGWFLERDLGPGPSLSGWYGTAVLVHLLLIGPLSNVTRREDDRTIASSVGTIIGLTAASLLIAGASFLTGHLFGWI